MYFILDQFTDIQSVLGFDGSEQVLVEISQRLRIVFPSPAFISRIGFDHFVMYSPVHFTEEESALSFENIKNELREPMIINGLEVYITFSYGIAYFPDHVNTAKDGLQAAQVALENARQKMSRNAEGFFQPNMHTFMKESLLSEMNLRKGLDLDQFELFYQPQVTCDTGEITGFEALIRWNHPEKGLVLPGDFISLAESTGLITLIGKWVIKQAFSQLSAWKAEGRDI